MAKITIKDEEGNERVHELVDAVTTIGRSSSCTVKVTDEKASRQHFRIEKDGDHFKVVDLGSTNGTRLNDEKITSEALCPEDVLLLGKTTFKYEGPGEPRKKKEEPAPSPLEGLKESDEEQPKYVIVMVEGADKGQTYELGIEPTTIGRKSGNTIKITDESASSYHAEVKKEPIGFVVSDLGSTNGTKVKAKGADEFEKIVKTPLAPGAQIRIGKTVFELRNVGAPTEDDDLLGTVVLDDSVPARLSDEIAPRPAPVGKPNQLRDMLVLAAAVLVFVGVVTTVVNLFGDNGNGENGDVANKGSKKKAPAIKLSNPSFSEGTDDAGEPKHWKTKPGQPGIRIEVSPDGEYNSELPEEEKKGLVIHKSGASSPACRSTVESVDTYPVDPSKTYEFKGALRNDGDGLYGFRLTWLKGRRMAVDHPMVLLRTQEWKVKSVDVRPPSWAERVRVGVFTEGREGKTCFDDLSFALKKGKKIDPAPTVTYGGVSVAFEGTKGGFSAKSGGSQAIVDGTLELVPKNIKAVSSLVSAIQPSLTAESGSAEYRGYLYDFALEDRTNYVIDASEGSAGVKLRFAVDRPASNASTPRVRFYVTGFIARGELEVGKGNGAKKHSQNARINESGVKEVLFNVGRSPQLYLVFSKPVSLDSRREGDRRRVQIMFPGEVTIDIAPENVGEREKMIALVKQLNQAVRRKQWAPAYKLKEQAFTLGNRFQEAKDAGRRAHDSIEGEWKKDESEIKDKMKILKELKNATPVETLLNQLGEKWAGTPYLRFLKNKKDEVEALKLVGVNQRKEEEAQDKLTRARRYYDGGGPSLQVAVSLLKKILRDFGKTKAAVEAKDLLAKAEEKKKKYDALNVINDRLLHKAESFRRAGDYRGAINAIRNDKEFQKHAHELPDINEKLKKWEKLANQ